MARTKYYHADEAAEILGVSVDDVRVMLANGELKGHKLGRRWLVNMDQPAFGHDKIEKCVTGQGKTVLRYVKNAEHEELVLKHLMSAKRSLYIATANFKNVHINDRTLITILNEMSKRGVAVKVICARLQSSEKTEFELIECPRNHMKLFIFDEKLLYIGSANLTPAALEDRGSKKRRTNNHEAGILTTDEEIIRQALEHFNSALASDDCKTCKIKECLIRNNSRYYG